MTKDFSVTFPCNCIPTDSVVVRKETGGGCVLIQPRKNGHSNSSYWIFLTPEHARDMAKAILDATEPKPEPKPQGYQSLTPLCRTVYQHMQRAGSISAREAMNDYGLSSGSLVRRICDIEEAGFKINRDRRKHPITGRLYTRYSLA